MTADFGDPLPVTLVTITSTEKRALTDLHGWFVLRDLAPGEYRVRVEQLGFMSRDTVIDLKTDSGPVSLRLAPQPIELPAVVVRMDERSCATRELSSPRDGAAVSAIIEEARKNVMRYRVLVDDYPFQGRYERTRSYLKKNGEVVGTKTDTIQWSSVDSRWAYEPGSALIASVTASGDTSYTLPAPSAYALSDAWFQESHCFRYAGVEHVGEVPHFRVDFDPLLEIAGPEVGGSLYLDSASFVLDKAVYRFVNLPKALNFSDVLAEIEYREIAPGLVIPAALRMSQRLDRVRFRGVWVDLYTEDHRLLDHGFVGPAPEADSPALRRDHSSRILHGLSDRVS